LLVQLAAHILFYFFKDFIYLLDREPKQGEQQREKQQREKQAPRRAGSPMRGSIPGPEDHDLS